MGGLDTVNTKRKFQAIGWAVLALLIPLTMALFLLSEVRWHNEKQFVLNQGSFTTGTITIRDDSHGDKGEKVTIKYTFYSSDREIIGHYTYDLWIPSSLDVGTRIAIAYNPQKPSINLPVDARENEKYFYMEDLPMLILLAIISCGLAVIFGYKARSAWRLSRD